MYKNWNIGITYQYMEPFEYVYLNKQCWRELLALDSKTVCKQMIKIK